MVAVRARGITLVELVVVLAIIAVLAAVGLRASYAAGARVRSGAEAVASLLRRVEQIAWAERRAYRVTFTPGTATLTIEYWTGTAWAASTAPVTAGWVSGDGVMPPGVAVRTTTLPSHRVVMNPLTIGSTGQVAVSVSPGAIYVSGPGGVELRVITGAAGDIVVVP